MIVHRRGRKHIIADVLSRIPCQQCGRLRHSDSMVEDCPQIAVTFLQSPAIPGVQNSRAEQVTDPMLEIFLRGKEADKKPTIDGKSVSRATRRLLQIWDQLTVCDRVLVGSSSLQMAGVL